MDRWDDVAEVPSGWGPSVVTLGTFDGVHRGHRRILDRVVALAAELGARSAAVTFDPHPMQVLFPDRAPVLVTSLDQRVDLIAETGMDGLLVLPFTRELASWSPERFVEEVLVGALGARAVVVGRDARFGHRNAGDVQTLRDLGERHGFVVEAIDDLGEGSVDDPAVPGEGASARRWSSSWARELLEAGAVDRAISVLGRPHRVGGVVVHGDHRGRDLGYPTANLSADPEGLVPADGIYAGWMVRRDLPREHADRLLPAAVSIGTNPTFHGTQRRVEAYVLDRTDLDLYGERVSLDLVARLRETLRFDSVEQLLEQMALDVDRCREILDGPVVQDVL